MEKELIAIIERAIEQLRIIADEAHEQDPSGISEMAEEFAHRTEQKLLKLREGEGHEPDDAGSG